MLFTFPSRYLFTIGRQVVFSLRRWSSQIQTGFLVSRPTRGHHQQKLRFRRRGSHPLWPAFPCRWSSVTFSDCCARRLSRLSCPSTPCLQRQPAITQPRFRLFPFRSPLLGESHVVFSSSGYSDVSVPPVPSITLWIHVTVSFHHEREVPPFGYPRITACVRLPEAFRCSPRPSSAPDA